MGLLRQVRDRSLIRGRGGGGGDKPGGGEGGEGWQVKFHPFTKRGRAEKILAMLMGGGGGHNKFWGNFTMEA